MSSKQELAKYFMFFNEVRPHQTLANQTPDAVYYGGLALKQAA